MSQQHIKRVSAPGKNRLGDVDMTQPVLKTAIESFGDLRRMLGAPQAVAVIQSLKLRQRETAS